MTASLVRKPSASDPASGLPAYGLPASGLPAYGLPGADLNPPLLSLGINELLLWLHPLGETAGSDAFCRQVLSRYAAIAAADWRFSRNANGKPALVGAPVDLQFNLSDSGDWLVCAIAMGTAVGVDLEYCDPGRDVLKLARRCFSPAELADMQACGNAEQSQRFYDYWTLKEATIKSRGGSLGRELEATRFELEMSPRDAKAVIRAVPADRDFYCLLDSLSGYRLAVCRHGAAHLQPRLRLFNLAADCSEQELPLVMRASSSSES